LGRETDLPKWEIIPNLKTERKTMSVGTILLVLLILMLIGAFPTWPHSKNWGYYPSGGLGLVVVILLILLLLGRI
jgi:asparagine N-glycosylation enzyme membrane subunit Stt3